MTEESYPGAERAGGGGSYRLLLAALVMIAAGLGLWGWDDRGDDAAKPHVILAGQNR